LLRRDLSEARAVARRGKSKSPATRPGPRHFPFNGKHPPWIALADRRFDSGGRNAAVKVF
jgi:hypothetical protein